MVTESRLVQIRVAHRATGNPRSTGWWLTLCYESHVPAWRVYHARSVMPDGPYSTRAAARARRAVLLQTFGA